MTDAAQEGLQPEDHSDQRAAADPRGPATEAGDSDRISGSGQGEDAAQPETLTSVEIETRSVNIKLNGTNVNPLTALDMFEVVLAMVSKAEPTLEAHNTGFTVENIGGMNESDTTVGFGSVRTSVP